MFKNRVYTILHNHAFLWRGVSSQKHLLFKMMLAPDQ